MEEKYTQLRIKRLTNQKLKLCGALTNEKLIDLIDRLVSEELAEHSKDIQFQTVNAFCLSDSNPIMNKKQSEES